MKTWIPTAVILLSALCATMPASGAEPTQAGMLRIAVSNVRVGRGHLHVAICPQALYLGDGCAYKIIVPARQGETVAMIGDVPAGTYAAQVYFDENDNDTLDRSLIGIPEEGVGFSNDPSFLFRAPSFAETAFRFDGMTGSINVRLRYY
ncbi:MAG TPA: DUF2141 domain-containing protein [Micropepsaceae bacterium]